ncbi:MAG: superoxide dismutase [Deltaproteobacteria bacterium]|nr:superoxide dismutase [Deltaproteobacteria bacterium]
MKFELPPLPYAKNALAPHISEETLEFHYGKHHQAYMTNLKGLLEGKPEANKSLEEIVMDASGGVFNNAAQVWNHSFFWSCVKPGGGGKPTGELASMIDRDFGGYDKFREAFTKTCVTQFGSGWGWLVLEGDKLALMQTSNADLPMKHGRKALLTIDVWEHAYYIDYRNLRPKFVETVIDNLLDWDFALQNLKG